MVEFNTPPGQFHHDLRSATFPDREQRLFSNRAITNAYLSKTMHQASDLQLRLQLAETQNNQGMCIPVQ